MPKNVRLGTYRHYKGKLYQVIGVAHHSETLEALVVYKALYRTRFGKNSLWVRPKGMFFEAVVVDGKKIKRFQYLKK
jgi:hypothetical protein